MNVIPVAAFLKDFSECLPEPVGITQQDEAEERHQLIEAAREAGLSAGREKALAEAEARMAEREAQFSQQLIAAREAWCAAESAPLAASLATSLSRLRDDVIEATAEVLRPFVIEAVRKQALADLAAVIKDILVREAGPAIAISGPADLLRNLELQLSEYAGAMTFTPSQSCEVEVTAGHALLSTRISAWVNTINEA